MSFPDCLGPTAAQSAFFAQLTNQPIFDRRDAYAGFRVCCDNTPRLVLVAGFGFFFTTLVLTLELSGLVAGAILTAARLWVVVWKLRWYMRGLLDSV